MAASATEICNIALRKLREQPIAALTENSEPARLCNAVYDDALDYLLARHPHNFAMRRRALAQNAQAPAFQYAHGYALPTDPYCLRAYRLWHGGRWVEEWVVEGRDLLTDYDQDLQLLYIARVADVTSYSPTFTNAFATYLAAQIAYALTRSEARRQALAEQFRLDWREHRAADGGEGWHEEPAAGVFVTARA